MGYKAKEGPLQKWVQKVKSFYASVECAALGLDPLETNLVVADPTRTDKTICLAVSPSLKAYGIGGRARLFEVIQKVSRINADRRRHAPGRRLTGKSSYDPEVRSDPSLDGIGLNFDDNLLDILTGVDKVEAAEKDVPIYNTAGQRLEKVRKGINIIGDKKVLVK